MTRGTLYLITDGKTYQSIEFNGDMYFDGGHGGDVVNLLRAVKSKEDFDKVVYVFNKMNFGYKEKLVHIFPTKYTKKIKGKKLFDFSGDKPENNYYALYFSDYLFFKNISGETVYFKDKETLEIIELENNDIAVFNFGRLYKMVEC